MAPKIDLEARVTIKKLHSQGLANQRIAKILRVTEGAVRYHIRRQKEGVVDGRSRQLHLAEAYRQVIDGWLEAKEGEPLNLRTLHGFLTREHGYRGSERSLQRFFRAKYPRPKRRARRRVETPPGAQAQVDWGAFPHVWVGGRETDLQAFALQLSHSRYGALVWSGRKDQLAWHRCHNEAFRRVRGIAAVLRIDNEKTAVSSGAGPWGTVNRAYRQYAREVRFHIDACLPRCPEHKGKVERRIGDHRFHVDPRARHWDSMEELQEWTDEETLASAQRRMCPATGKTVYETWQQEIPFLQPVPVLPEPFDVAVRRPVQKDCMVAFESRSYSVPFRLIGARVEVRGCSGRVQFVHDGEVVATHPRHTEARIVIDPAHFEGRATEHVLPPLPLGRMGRRLQEIADLEPEKRPLDLYAALAEVAR